VSRLESGGGDSLYGDPVDDDPLQRYIEVDGVRYTSLGPFQERIAGGAGETHVRKGGALADLFNPVSATERFFDRFKRAAEIAPLNATPGEIAAEAQKPFDKTGYASKVDALLASLRSSATPRDAHNTGTVPVTGRGNCPPGHYWSILEARCVPEGYQYDPRGPIAKGDMSPVPDVGKAVENVTKGVTAASASVTEAIDRARSGAAELAVAVGVIAVAGILIYSGIRKTLG
jgi:hypothetical protein